MSTSITHPELLERAHRLSREADAGDVEGVRREATLLVEDLSDHLLFEELEVRELPTFTARLVLRGQERLIEELLLLALEVQRGADGGRWRRLVDEIVVRLAAQVDAERRAFVRHQAAAPGVCTGLGTLAT